MRKINKPNGLIGVNGKKPIAIADILPYLPDKSGFIDTRHWVLGGVMYSKSKRFFSGGLKNISATLLANQHNNGVVEVYEEDIKCD